MVMVESSNSISRKSKSSELNVQFLMLLSRKMFQLADFLIDPRWTVCINL